MFLDLPDLDPSLFVRMWIRILPSSSKKFKKNLYFYCIVNSYDLLSSKNDVNIPLEVKSKKTLIFCKHLEGFCRKDPEQYPDPDLYQNVTDLRHWFCVRIRMRIIS
jgi:hypothetical protein